MKVILFMFLSFQAFSQDAESDLQKPVSDITEIQRQEWEEIPTIEEVPIKNTPDGDDQKRVPRSEETMKELPRKPRR